MERECIVFAKDKFTAKGDGFDISVKVNESMEIYLPEPTSDSEQCVIRKAIDRFKNDIKEDPSSEEKGANEDCYACGQFISVHLYKRRHPR